MLNFKLKTKNLSEDVTMKNLPTVRQAFVAASVMIIAAVVLSKIVHPDWIYFALLPAAGLLFSGLSGFCPLVFMLQSLPGNKQK